jgi:tripartite-type tricarboxylate transporter receptor subunit TctC
MQNKKLNGLLKYFFRVLALLLCVGISPTYAQASFPEKPVRIVVPFPPGGGTDLVVRALAAGMATELGQSVIIENKAGAGTVIGTDFVAKSPPDGYTLLVGTFAFAVNPSLLAKLPFDTNKAFAPVVLISRSPNVLVVRADSPYKSVQDVVRAALANPGKLTYASQGNGTSAHLAAELFKALAKVDITHIPYKGASPALTDIVGGQVDLMFATSAGATPLLESGRLRALAVTTPERSPAFPALPTMVEAGIPEYQATSWYGLYAPAGTPNVAIDRLNAAATKVAQADAFKSRVASEGLVISTGTPKQLDEFMLGEQSRWARVIQSAGIKAN